MDGIIMVRNSEIGWGWKHIFMMHDLWNAPIKHSRRGCVVTNIVGCQDTKTLPLLPLLPHEPLAAIGYFHSSGPVALTWSKIQRIDFQLSKNYLSIVLQPTNSFVLLVKFTGRFSLSNKDCRRKNG